MKDAIDEPRLVRYLLGESGPDEQEQIEREYVSNPARLDELHAVERDLIDRYVRGELAAREAFERHFLASPARRARVEFARALMQADLVSRRAGGGYRWWPLAAAALLVLALGSWLWLATRPVAAPDLARADAPATPDRDTATPPPMPPGTAPPPPPPNPAPRVATLLLLPTATRDAGGPPVLIIGDATEAQLRLSVEAAGHRSYRAVIRTADGVDILRQDGLTAQSETGGAVVTLTFPAARLANDDYTVTLSGVLPSGEAEELAGYYFRARPAR